MNLDNLDLKLNNQVAILICGHGSRNKLAITEFQELTKFIQKRYPNFLVEYGFLEFAKPSIVDALDKLKDLSIKKVIAIPAMLFAAGHVKNDIPSLLLNYSSKTGIEIIYGRELGINNLIDPPLLLPLQLLLNWFFYQGEFCCNFFLDQEL